MQDQIILPSPQATESLGARLAPALHPGDVLLLEGPLGAGKSALARALIRARQRAAGHAPEDVPSPSYTLVQTYAAGALEIWHADLYRLGDPGEVAELGLEDAFAHALVLVEWPDRLGDARPARALTLRLEPDADRPDTRRLTVRAEGGGWDAALAALARGAA